MNIMANKKIIDAIKDEIEKSGKTRYQIAIETGLPQSLLFRLYHDTTGISLKTAQTLCDYFGLRIIKDGE